MKYTLDNLKKVEKYLTIATLTVLENSGDNVSFEKMGEQYIKHLGIKSAILCLENGGELDGDVIGALDFLFSESPFKGAAEIFNKEESQDDNATSNS